MVVGADQVTATQAAAQVRIGAYDFDVFFDLDRETSQMQGYVDLLEHEIHIVDGLKPMAAARIVWHEVVHALIDTSGNQEEHDEQLVDSLAHGIVQVLRDNPALRNPQE